MRRYSAKVDEGHAEVVKALRAAGCQVLSLAAVGKGAPDLLVYRRQHGWKCANQNCAECRFDGLFLLEVKAPEGPNGGASAHGQKLNPAQVAFASQWPVKVVHSPEEALKAVLE